jgi:hypothetical protein
MSELPFPIKVPAIGWRGNRLSGKRPYLRLEVEQKFLYSSSSTATDIQLSKEDKMKGHLARVLLCAVLLSPAVAPRLAVAADKPNEFGVDRKNDLDFKGAITALDATAGSVTIKNKEKGAMTFAVAKDCLLFVKHKKDGVTLADFKVGEEVRVLYSQAGTAIVCHSMWQPGSNPSEKQRKLEDEKTAP